MEPAGTAAVILLQSLKTLSILVHLYFSLIKLIKKKKKKKKEREREREREKKQDSGSRPEY